MKRALFALSMTLAGCAEIAGVREDLVPAADEESIDASADASDAAVDADRVDAAAACGEGQTVCDGRCVNLQSDPLNCGACAAACTANRVCDDGDCRQGGGRDAGGS